MTCFIRIGLISLAACLLISLYGPSPVFADPPKEGDVLPELRFTAPADAAGKAYLGVDGDTFALADLQAEAAVIEIVGVYCSICHKQAPTMRKFFSKLKKDDEVSGKAVFFAEAAGGAPAEVDYMKNKHKSEYPILPDEKFVAHLALNEPKTPFTMIVAKDGRVLYSHLGLLKSENDLLTAVRKAVGR